MQYSMGLQKKAKMQIKARCWSDRQTMIWGSMALGKGQSSIYAPPYWGHNFGSATVAWKGLMWKMAKKMATRRIQNNECIVLLPWVVLTALLHLKFLLVLGNSQAPSAWTMSKCGVSMTGREFVSLIFLKFWPPVLPILITLASMARVENHISSSKI